MTASPSGFAALLAGARQGDPESQLELVRKYEPEVRIVVRVLLGPALRPYLDSIDLVQSVHHSLLLGLRHEKYRIATPEQLIGLAVTVARRKVARKWRQNRRQLRAQAPAAAHDDTVEVLTGLVSQERDPANAARFDDTVRRLWDQLAPLDRRVIELRMEGCSTVEAAGLLGEDPDRLRVRLHRLRQQVRQSGLLDDWL